MPDEKQIHYKRPIWANLKEIRRDENWVWFEKSAGRTIQTSLENVEAWEKKKKK